jgi:hypothetical protein
MDVRITHLPPELVTKKKREGLVGPEKQTEIHTITPACTDRPSSFVVVVCKPFKSLRQRGHLVLLSVKVDNEELPDEALAKVFQVRVTAVPLAEPLPHLLFQSHCCPALTLPLTPLCVLLRAQARLLTELDDGLLGQWHRAREIWVAVGCSVSSSRMGGDGSTGPQPSPLSTSSRQPTMRASRSDPKNSDAQWPCRLPSPVSSASANCGTVHPRAAASAITIG